MLYQLYFLMIVMRMGSQTPEQGEIMHNQLLKTLCSRTVTYIFKPIAPLECAVGIK